MRYLELLTEANLTFTPADIAKAAAENEYHVVYLTMAGDGQIYIGDFIKSFSEPQGQRPDVSYKRALRITLLPGEKRISISRGAVGENLKPKVQQALRSLRDGGIIDASWRLETARGPGRYVDSKYTNEPNPVDQKTLDELVDKAIRLSPVTQNLVLYHGTSSVDWVKIQRVGLHPLNFGTNTEHGFESRGKHDGNTKVLYLAGTLEKAYDYAKTRAEGQQREYRKVQDWKSVDSTVPVVLAVHVPDPARLVADDDVVNAMARSIGYKLWKAKPPEDQERIGREMAAQGRYSGTDPTVIGMLWRETTEGFAEIMARLPPRVFQVWLASLKRENQVGYKGFIPPKFLKRVM
jgi:hypothetical protein